MKKKSSTKAILAVMQDAQFLKKTAKFLKATIEINSD